MKLHLNRVKSRKACEPIDMRARRFGYFPLTFLWRGCLYHVEAVERCWTTAKRSERRMDRHYFSVRCAEGVFQLYQDLKTNTWHIEVPTRQRKAVLHG